MCYLTVTCYNCLAEYHIYSDTMIEEGSDFMCPHCLATIPKKVFKKMRNALFCLEEVNKDLRVAHEGKGKPLSQVEIRNHYVATKDFNNY